MTTWKRGESIGASLALLLTLLLLGAANAWLPGGNRRTALCEEPLFAEAAGDVPRAGVHAFCKTTVKVIDLFQRAEGRGAFLPASKNALWTRRLSSGVRVVFRSGAKGVRPAGIERMNAFRCMTLGVPFSVNRASREELTALPGVGPRLARAMVDFRERNEGFVREKDLLKVRGIGPEMLKRLRPHIIVP